MDSDDVVRYNVTNDDVTDNDVTSAILASNCVILECTAVNYVGNITEYLYSGKCGQNNPLPSTQDKTHKTSLIVGLCLATLVLILAVFIVILVKSRAGLQNKHVTGCRHSGVRGRTLVERSSVGSEVNLLPSERSMTSLEEASNTWS